MLAPARTVTVHRRSSDPWFDDECRTVKRSVRLVERLARRCPSVENRADWQSRRRNYRALLRTKHKAFLAQSSRGFLQCPRKLWSSFDSILGRGRTPVSDAIGASTLHEFFDHKVDAIRDATSCADPPTFTSVLSDCDLSSIGTVTTDDVITDIRRLPDKRA